MTVIAVLAIVVLIVVRGKLEKANAKITPDRYGQSPDPIPVLPFKVAPFVVAFVWVLITLFSSVHTVENGHVGLVYSFGGITGQRGDGHGGLVLTMPWESVEEANVQVQKVHPDSTCSNGAEHCMDAFSSESQDVYIQATINVHVNPGDIQGLYREIGPDYINKLVLPRVAQITKEETVKYKAKDIAPNREKIRTVIASRLTLELQPRSIVVDDFLLTNIDFTPAFKQAIDASTTAEQKAQTEQNNVEIVKAQAEQVVEKAKGDASAEYERALGVAKANDAINASLTPELIQYLTIQKLAPNVSVIMIPSSNGLILDMGSLTSASTASNQDTGEEETPTP